MSRVLYLIVCAAGPAREVGQLVEMVQSRGWDVWLIATPSAVGFLDIEILESQTGHPVSSEYRRPMEPRTSRPFADAIVIAPATYNTINKWASGVSDTYALGILSEAFGFGIPLIVLPFVNQAMAGHFAWQRNVEDLGRVGVKFLLTPETVHPLGKGSSDSFPWQMAAEELES